MNCSTTIHSNVDVLKVLSTSGTNDADMAEMNNKPVNGNSQNARPSARKTILKALGVRQNGHNAHIPQMDAGMENGVLGRMEGQDLNSQMKEFYTAYSKVSSFFHWARHFWFTFKSRKLTHVSISSSAPTTS